MTVAQVFQQIASDSTFKALLVLIALDVVLGVAAAVKQRDFAFSKVAGFLRDDVLAKVLPWAALEAGALFAPSSAALGVDLGVVADGAFVLAVAALVGSLTSSLETIGLKIPTPTLTRGENEG